MPRWSVRSLATAVVVLLIASGAALRRQSDGDEAKTVPVRVGQPQLSNSDRPFSVQLGGISRTVGPARGDSAAFDANNGATGLLSARDEAGHVAGLAPVPVDSDGMGSRVSAGVDYRTTALSLLLLTPGMTVTEPVSVRLLGGLVSELPEFDGLANTLRAESTTRVEFLEQPSPATIAALDALVGALLRRMAELRKELGLPPQGSGPTSSRPSTQGTPRPSRAAASNQWGEGLGTEEAAAGDGSFLLSPADSSPTQPPLELIRSSAARQCGTKELKGGGPGTDALCWSSAKYEKSKEEWRLEGTNGAARWSLLYDVTGDEGKDDRDLKLVGFLRGKNYALPSVGEFFYDLLESAVLGGTYDKGVNLGKRWWNFWTGVGCGGDRACKDGLAKELNPGVIKRILDKLRSVAADTPIKANVPRDADGGQVAVWGIGPASEDVPQPTRQAVAWSSGLTTVGAVVVPIVEFAADLVPGNLASVLATGKGVADNVLALANEVPRSLDALIKAIESKDIGRIAVALAKVSIEMIKRIFAEPFFDIVRKLLASAADDAKAKVRSALREAASILGKATGIGALIDAAVSGANIGLNLGSISNDVADGTFTSSTVYRLGKGGPKRGEQGPADAQRLRRRDWSRENYPVDCSTPGLGVRVAEPFFADLTGDGREDAVVSVDCEVGAGASPDATFAFVDDGGSESGKRFELISFDYGVHVRNAFSEGGLLRIDAAGYSSSDVPSCCPDSPVRYEFRWEGGRFIETSDQNSCEQVMAIVSKMTQQEVAELVVLQGGRPFFPDPAAELVDEETVRFLLVNDEGFGDPTTRTFNLRRRLSEPSGPYSYDDGAKFPERFVLHPNGGLGGSCD